MSRLVDSYEGDGASSTTWALANGFNTTTVQSFQSPLSGKLSSAKFYLKNATSVTGTCYYVLYAHTGTYGSGGVPTGSVLATSEGLNVATLSSSFTLNELSFTGANQYNLVEGTVYCIGVTFTGGDGDHYIQVGIDTTSPSHGGNRASYISSWTSYANDQSFYVYIRTDIKKIATIDNSDSIKKLSSITQANMNKVASISN